MKKIIFILNFIVATYGSNAQVLYGTTSFGGDNKGGTICKLVTTTNTLTAAFSFDAVDGRNPVYTKLLQASNGKLYGMTSAGGSSDRGTIFSYNPVTSLYTKLLDFDGANGSNPYGSLIQASDGKLYGMTYSGGDHNYGVIFSYNTTTLAYTKLIDFDGTNGSNPSGSMIQASDGKLYGMTSYGGSFLEGIIFSYDPATSSYIKLYDFDYKSGGEPNGSLIQASDGKLYGMTAYGGYDAGVIFSYDPSTLTYMKMKDFYSWGGNGYSPVGSLIQASDGKLYGMTDKGGSNNRGVIFSIDPITSVYTQLKSFIDYRFSNGAYPSGDLMEASDGNLIGMTSAGGDNDAGVIFSFDPATSAYTKLIDFDGTNGRYPSGSLVQASDGRLYGMTDAGGSPGYGSGVIFSYNLISSTYTKLRDFGKNNTGDHMAGALIKYQAKNLYGMTLEGGSYGVGTIFSYDVNTSVFTKIKDFDFTNGASPKGNLLRASDGKLYGTTSEGGSKGLGVIFSYDPFTSVYTKLMDFELIINGGQPVGSLIQASDGKLYGMADYGAGGGVIFSYDPVTSVYTILKNFSIKTGINPSGDLVQASDGKMYGMTKDGGSANRGVIFSYDPVTSIYTKLMDFDNTEGATPNGSLIQASDGKLYGMTSQGGGPGYGVIFSYDPSTSTYTKMKNFNGTNGAFPLGSLVQASDGKLYGMTSQGGSNNYGVAFSYDPSTSTYTKLNDFSGDNGSYPGSTSFIEVNSALPLQLISFTGFNNGNKNILNWKTAAELNSNRYEVERSFDSRNFEKIGEVKSINSVNGHVYSYADNLNHISANDFYYRLKMIDNDGKYTYSNGVSIHVNNSNEKIAVLGNLAASYINVTTPISILQKPLDAEIFNSNGVLVKRINITNSSTIIYIDKLAAGKYFISFNQDGKVIQTAQLVKQ